MTVHKDCKQTLARQKNKQRRYRWIGRWEINRPTTSAGPNEKKKMDDSIAAQVVPADVQSATRTCTDLPRRSVSTNGISWQQTETAICYSQRPRHQPNCHVPYFGARSFAVAGPKAWNQLPADIRAIDSVNSFKSAVKTFLFR